MTYRTAPRLSESDLDDLLRAADPLAEPGSDAVTQAHLASAGAVLTHRVAAAERRGKVRIPRRWRRRLLGVAAAVVVLPTAAVVIGPTVAARFGARAPFVGTAVASDGRLTCEGGYAQAIPPATAPVRLWPAALPTGWKVTTVYARRPGGINWCTAPSLVAARTDRTGLITGTVSLTGPVAGISLDDHTENAPDRVGVYRATRLTARDHTGYHTWVVTDASGAQWFAAVDGYPLTQARAVLAAATLGGTVTWNPHRAPGLTVVHSRTGAPYPTTVRTGLDWYLDLDAHGVHRQMEAWTRPGGASVTAQVTVGTRLLTVHGTQMLVGIVDGRPTAVYADTPSGAVAWSDVAGDLSQVEARLLSLTNLPASDPRLRIYALHEKY